MPTKKNVLAVGRPHNLYSLNCQCPVTSLTRDRPSARRPYSKQNRDICRPYDTTTRRRAHCARRETRLRPDDIRLRREIRRRPYDTRFCRREYCARRETRWRQKDTRRRETGWRPYHITHRARSYDKRLCVVHAAKPAGVHNTLRTGVVRTVHVAQPSGLHTTHCARSYNTRLFVVCTVQVVKPDGVQTTLGSVAQPDGIYTTLCPGVARTLHVAKPNGVHTIQDFTAAILHTVQVHTTYVFASCVLCTTRNPMSFIRYHAEASCALFTSRNPLALCTFMSHTSSRPAYCARREARWHPYDIITRRRAYFARHEIKWRSCDTRL